MLANQKYHQENEKEVTHWGKKIQYLNNSLYPEI